MNQTILNHPLLFKLHETVQGCGFLVSVAVSGSAVMQQDADLKWWMYGVVPGAIAASGTTVSEAFGNFRTAFTETLFDIADECKEFLEFKSEVESYFRQVDTKELEIWEAALHAVRERGTMPPDEFADLERMTPDQLEPNIVVDRLDKKQSSQFDPAQNAKDQLCKAA